MTPGGRAWSYCPGRYRYVVTRAFRIPRRGLSPGSRGRFKKPPRPSDEGLGSGPGGTPRVLSGLDPAPPGLPCRGRTHFAARAPVGVAGGPGSRARFFLPALSCTRGRAKGGGHTSARRLDPHSSVSGASLRVRYVSVCSVTRLSGFEPAPVSVSVLDTAAAASRAFIEDVLNDTPILRF